MAVIIQIRNDTAANWTSANPILAKGEVGIETDTGKAKYGDGVTAWNSLVYFIKDIAQIETNTTAIGTLANLTTTEKSNLVGAINELDSDKQDAITVTASKALVSNSSGKVAASSVTATELGYLSGVTSAIQTQINGKQAKATYDSTNKMLVL